MKQNFTPEDLILLHYGEKDSLNKPKLKQPLKLMLL